MFMFILNDNLTFDILKIREENGVTDFIGQSEKTLK